MAAKKRARQQDAPEAHKVSLDLTQSQVRLLTMSQKRKITNDITNASEA